jgi:hypothetical protein
MWRAGWCTTTAASSSSASTARSLRGLRGTVLSALPSSASATSQKHRSSEKIAHPPTTSRCRCLEVRESSGSPAALTAHLSSSSFLLLLIRSRLHSREPCWRAALGLLVNSETGHSEDQQPNLRHALGSVSVWPVYCEFHSDLDQPNLESEFIPSLSQLDQPPAPHRTDRRSVPVRVINLE